MKKDGLARMLDFLNYISEKDIHYFIEQNAPDGLRVTLTLVGIRVEVVFTVDEMQFSYFHGNEDVEVDEKLLNKLIEENWD